MICSHDPVTSRKQIPQPRKFTACNFIQQIFQAHPVQLRQSKYFCSAYVPKIFSIVDIVLFIISTKLSYDGSCVFSSIWSYLSGQNANQRLLYNFYSYIYLFCYYAVVVNEQCLLGNIILLKYQGAILTLFRWK